MVINAIRYLGNGFSVVPTKGKRPIVPWKQYQYKTPDASQIIRWWANSDYGIAIVCGISSDGLAVLDFDDRDAFNTILPFLDTFPDDFLTVGTPNGFHLYFRCSDLVKTTKLAMTTDGAVLVELKGVGGYVIAPNPPDSSYVLLAGSFGHIPTLSKQDVARIVIESRKLDQRPPVDHVSFRGRKRGVGKTVQSNNVFDYIEHHIKQVEEKICNAGNGNRNNTLFSSACWVGEMVGGGYVTRDSAEDMLYNAAQSSGLVSDGRDGRNQTRKTIRFGLRTGIMRPLTIESDSILDGVPA